MILADAINTAQSIDVGMLLGGGTLGSIATQLVTKWIGRKKDSSDISSQTAILMKTVNDDLVVVVKRLQEIACYRSNCNERINGEIDKQK